MEHQGHPAAAHRLPELLAADKGALVFFVEGEKDVDRLRSSGLAATSSPEGAGRWRDDFASCLTSRRVVIIPDNDEQGEAHAEAVFASLRRRGIVSAMLRLEGLPHKGDVCDWLKAGGTPEKLVEMAQALLQPSCDLTPTPFQWIDPASIPPRPWLYGRHLIRKQVSVTVAAGGTGKSSLTIAEAVAMTSRPGAARRLGVRPAPGLAVQPRNTAMNCSGASSRRYSTIA